MDLEQVLSLCSNGDELAWEMLVRRYQGRVFAIALTYAGDREEARDLTQDVFVRLYRNLESCREVDRFLPWLVRIARNVCLDHLRRRKARPPVRDIPVEEVWDLASDAPSPAQQSEDHSRRRLVAAALQQISDINREIILLKDIQGLSLDDIAKMLDLPLGTVKSRTNRARIELARAVRNLLNPPGAEALA